MKKEKILEIKNLTTELITDKGTIFPVNDISLDIYKGQTMGIVGESGSGKTMTALSILKLNPNQSKIVNGQVIFENKNILELKNEEIRKIRGNDISMIFQEPMTSLNPVFTIGNQIKEVYLTHTKNNLKESEEKSLEILKKVGIPNPKKIMQDYPHNLSGGMRQRVMIAMALACNPKILIADEPTTALDVTIQAQILDLLKQLREEFNMGILMITHDMRVIAEICDEVAVMYCGKIIEQTDKKSLFQNPQHHYTKGLLDCIPKINTKIKIENRRLKTIKGIVPSLNNLPNGCNFQKRCPKADEECRGKNGDPDLFKIDKNLIAACFHPLEKQN
ncbi:MAG: ABC transporter ATP-binding protein [Bacteroidetes bacterium]|nr:ABC transporter ATP-binding protein [Bacteroidota bacterium]